MDEICNAIIESVSLNDSDNRGILTCWVTLDYGGMSQGFGGHALYLDDAFTFHQGSLKYNFAGHFIWRVMQIAGVSDWSRVKGKTVRAKIEKGSCVAIGHIVKDDWFNPSEDFSKWRNTDRSQFS